MSSILAQSPLLTLLNRFDGGDSEGLEIEFKSGKGGLPKSIWPTVSAFANTRGGWIILGVNEENPDLIEGVNNPSKLLDEFYSCSRNPQKLSVPVCGADDGGVETIEDKNIVVLRIPATPRKSRPVYVAGNPYQGTYLRRNSGDYRCTKQEVDRMMREASDVTADSTVVSGVSLKDLDLETLARYRRRYQTTSPASPWNSYDDKRFLRAIGGFRRDKDTGKEGVTVAGLLLAGLPEAIREWRARHLIDYRLLSTDEGTDQRWDDRVAWEGNLYTAFETIYPKLVGGHPIPFRLVNGIRTEETPVHTALREALVNLLVHADYAETHASLIVRSPKGYSFRNPGNSRISEVELLSGDRSDPRNPEIVRMFRLAGLAEEAGTGMPKIIKTWREQGFQMPAISVGTERYEFSLELHHSHLLSEEDRAWLSTIGDSWSEAEQLALIMARHDGGVDNSKLRKLTGLHSADATKVLVSLRDRNLLRMERAGKNTHYLLGLVAQSRSTKKSHGKSLGLGPIQQSLLSERKDDTPAGFSIGNNTTGIGNKAPDLGTKESDLGYKDLLVADPPFDTNLFNSKDIWPDLESFSKEVRESRRISPASRDLTIVKLCSLTPLSVKELSLLLGRSVDLIRGAVQALVERGDLKFLYPDSPKHPRQKYTAS